MIIFVTGGARSGKSDFAQQLAENMDGKRLFLATARALDHEMKERIRRHREKRGDRWDTLEENVSLGSALRTVSGSYGTVVVDCFTLWMSNLLGEYSENEGKLKACIDDFFAGIEDFEGTLIVISNEVGQGIVPENALARAYRDRLGLLNQRMARRADKVYVLLSGIPVVIKE